MQFVRDELKAAADKQGEQAKEHIRVAIDHAEATRREVEANLKEQHAKNKVQLESVAEHLTEATRQAKAAIDAKGSQFEEHLKKSLAAAKAAFEKHA
ncbi:MAG: hypothetical protein JO029_00295 [Candidatus Eremiobacteraeota bacterium]|nr:hypothetical protein [Candidatus Eremiobacteraeota bacterium]MBV8655829.1 hypothetical protein [Candidatus Eremiobacteraeota bacterium]